MKQYKRIAMALLALGGVSMLPMPAQALVRWTMTGCDTSSPSYGNTCSYGGVDTGTNAATGSVGANAWANTASGGTTLETAAVLQWGGGLGVGNRNEGLSPGAPQHSTDNVTSMDLIVFDFGSDSVTLSEIALGWFKTDSDISVLAWTGAGTPDVDGKTYSTGSEGLTSSGWTLIGNYDVDYSDSSNPYRQNISTAISSSYWLVGAYNQAFGYCNPGAGICQMSPYDDYVKILELKGSITPPNDDTPPGVPAPASLLLLLGGLAPLAWRRRRLEREAVAEC